MSRMPAALLLVDIQNDFLPPSGALAVPQGDSILTGAVHRLLDEGKWDLVVASQDHHPQGHISFASRHGQPAFSAIEVSLPPTRGSASIKQELWPDHCVQGTEGCQLEHGVLKRLDRLRESGRRVEIVSKGEDVDLNAYSAFSNPLSVPSEELSPLARMLLESSIDTLAVVGLATDFCVRATVLSALETAAKACPPWRVFVVREGVRGVATDREEEVLRELSAKGAQVVSIDGAELEPFLGNP
ncbi:hypothetical protein JCM11641_006069 [Rhodosporidiobolus odoratus]